VDMNRSPPGEAYPHVLDLCVTHTDRRLKLVTRNSAQSNCVMYSQFLGGFENFGEN
jgi:hypothetical protein